MVEPEEYLHFHGASPEQSRAALASAGQRLALCEVESVGNRSGPAWLWTRGGRLTTTSEHPKGPGELPRMSRALIWRPSAVPVAAGCGTPSPRLAPVDYRCSSRHCRPTRRLGF